MDSVVEASDRPGILMGWCPGLGLSRSATGYQLGTNRLADARAMASQHFSKVCRRISVSGGIGCHAQVAVPIGEGKACI